MSIIEKEIKWWHLIYFSLAGVFQGFFFANIIGRLIL